MSRHYDDFGYSARQRREDDEGDAYTVAYAMEDDRRRREWEAQFDIPYRSNGTEIHRALMQRMSSKHD
jgi:hypothetical protein